MLEMGGYELGRHLREDWPHVPILYMSGYGESHSSEAFCA
jgi:CheY-like chemotaxis protein